MPQQLVRAQQHVHPCTTAARSCAAAGTSVCSSSSFMRSSTYIRAPQQLVCAQQQVHPCAAAARSCTAARTSVRHSSSFVRSSRYIRVQQQLVRAQQQVHLCATAARSCAAALLIPIHYYIIYISDWLPETWMYLTMKRHSH